VQTEAASRGANHSEMPLRVFLVEDLPAVRALVVESLEEIQGLQLAGFAETETGAVSWLSSHECEVLILDLELKEGTGIGVLKRLAAEHSRPGLVKIIYSNHVGQNIRRVAEKLGATYFFDKTLDTPQLHVLLKRLSGGGGDKAAGAASRKH
jgi:DNA-binding NarL/FixJ family response regulator